VEKYIIVLFFFKKDRDVLWFWICRF